MKSVLNAGTALATTLVLFPMLSAAEPAVPLKKAPPESVATAPSPVPDGIQVAQAAQSTGYQSGTPSPTLAAAPASGRGPAPIIITASPIAGAADRFATIVTQVSRGDITKQGGANLTDALRGVPGVTGTSFAAGASRPVIRGFDANRVRVLENGIGSFDVSDIGPDHGVPIDPLATQSIEIVRGAATLRYGSQAIGGVVNAIDNRIPTFLPEKMLSGEAAGGYDTNGASGEGSLQADARFGSLALHGDGFYRHVGDYDTPAGTQLNSKDRSDGGSLGGSLFLDPNDRIGGAFEHFESQYGIPSDTTYIKMRQSKGIVGSSFDLNSGPFQTLTIDGGYANYHHVEIDPIDGPQDIFIDKEWDSRAETVLGRTGFLSASALGVQVQHRDFSALEAVSGAALDYINPATTKSYAGFGFAEAPLGKSAHLQFGARVEHVDVDGTPDSGVHTTVHFTPVSGAAGVLFDVSQDLKLGITLSSAARAPANTELFAKGPHDGPNTFEIGDPALKLERANSLEGSLRLKVGSANIESSLWGTKFSNFIYGQVTGVLCDDDGTCPEVAGGDLKQLFYKQQNATFWGNETKLTAPLWQSGNDVFVFEALGDYVRAKLKDGSNVPRIPPYHVGGGFAWNSDQFDAGFLWIYAGPQNHPGTAETPTKGYTDLDAQIAWRPFAQHQGVELAVMGHNLTNDDQRNAASLNKDDILLPGRNVRFVLRAAF